MATHADVSLDRFNKRTLGTKGNGKGLLTDVKSIKDKIAKWSNGQNRIVGQSAFPENVPDVICDSRCVSITVDGRFTVSHRATNAQQNFLPNVLTGLDFVREAIADAVDQSRCSRIDLSGCSSPAIGSHVEAWIASWARGEPVHKG